MNVSLQCTQYNNNTTPGQVQFPYKNVSLIFCSNLTDLYHNGTYWSECQCLQSPEHDWFPLYTEVLSCIFYGLVFLFGTLGNGAVLAILMLYEKRTSSDYLIMSLAAGDLLNSIFSPMLIMGDVFTNYSWVFGRWTCEWLASTPLYFMEPFTSFHLMAIAGDRYRVIVHPFSRVRKKTLFAIIITIWTASFATATPAYLMHNFTEESQQCLPDPTNISDNPYQAHLIYIWTIVMISMVLGLLVLVVLYGISIRHLQQRLTRVQSVGSDEMRIKENTKVTNMFASVVLLFLLLITPNGINIMIQSYFIKFHQDKYFEPTAYDIFHKANIISFCIYSLSSIVNPWIYARKHKCVSRVVKRLWENGCKHNAKEVIRQAIHETHPPRRGTSVGRLQPLSHCKTSTTTLSQYLSTSTLRSSTCSIPNLEDFDTRL